MPFVRVAGLLFALVAGAAIVLAGVVQVHCRWIRRRMMVMGQESIGKEKKVMLAAVVAAGAAAGAREGVGAGRIGSGRFARAIAIAGAATVVVVIVVVIVVAIVTLGIVVAPGARGEGWG